MGRQAYRLRAADKGGATPTQHSEHLSFNIVPLISIKVGLVEKLEVQKPKENSNRESH
jgi:hypothetical protein